MQRDDLLSVLIRQSEVEQVLIDLGDRVVDISATQTSSDGKTFLLIAGESLNEPQTSKGDA